VSALIESRAVEPGQHVVQFYETDRELVEGAGAYLGGGSAARVVIATRAHREALRARVQDAIWLDAADTLASFMRDGRVDRDAFFERVGGVVHAAVATGRPVRAYGEMVSLLWEAGDVAAAIELETAWNDLAAQMPFSLYCAYRSASVAGHEHADALGRVCHLHSAVVTAGPVEKTWRFPADRGAPRDAREQLVDALRQLGHGGALLDDVRLVVTELAANAVVHARSPFFVSLRDEGRTVRVVVGDQSRDQPALRPASATLASGRGVSLIDALATRWGVEPTADGKVVWAEFSAHR
jgi:anti-sigma regulatory factor (Ser/Thr protein kinase)